MVIPEDMMELRLSGLELVALRFMRAMSQGGIEIGFNPKCTMITAKLLGPPVLSLKPNTPNVRSIR
jgi:hypothetical protein